MKQLIGLDEALALIKQNSTFNDKIGRESIDIDKSVGRVTAFDYYADTDFPPFNKSAMDGYVVVNPNLTEYKILGKIKAGDSSDITLNNDECLAIMTGAPVNKNGIKIIINEDVEVIGDKIKVLKNSQATNIAYKGEDLKSGEISLKKNSIITPFSVGTLANSGIKKVEVYKKVEIGVAITGDELIDIDKKPELGMIRDINSYTLLSKINSIPFCKVKYLGIVKDTLNETQKIINKFLDSDASLLILSGGSSRGDFDFVVKALESLKITILFEGVKVQPGKPVIFAKHKDKLIFGLPGNPVSVLISFEVFIKEALYRLQNQDYDSVVFNGELTEDFKRRNQERTLFFPVSIINNGEKNFVTPVKYNGSGHINSYNYIKYLGIIKEGITELKKGENILVRQIWQNY